MFNRQIVNKIINGVDYKPWSIKLNYTAHYANGDGFVNYSDAVEYCKKLPQLHMFMHDSGMVCTHNVPCPICRVDHAVFVTSSGHCEPCGKCQDIGWYVGFKPPIKKYSTSYTTFFKWLFGKIK